MYYYFTTIVLIVTVLSMMYCCGGPLMTRAQIVYYAYKTRNRKIDVERSVRKLRKPKQRKIM